MYTTIQQDEHLLASINTRLRELETEQAAIQVNTPSSSPRNLTLILHTAPAPLPLPEQGETRRKYLSKARDPRAYALSPPRIMWRSILLLCL